MKLYNKKNYKFFVRFLSNLPFSIYLKGKTIYFPIQMPSDAPFHRSFKMVHLQCSVKWCISTTASGHTKWFLAQLVNILCWCIIHIFHKYIPLIGSFSDIQIFVRAVAWTASSSWWSNYYFIFCSKHFSAAF